MKQTNLNYTSEINNKNNNTNLINPNYVSGLIQADKYIFINIIPIYLILKIVLFISLSQVVVAIL
jgi:hypothetical protein